MPKGGHFRVSRTKKLEAGQYGARFAKPVHSAEFDEYKPVNHDVYWRAEVLPWGTMGLDPNVPRQYIYGMTFKGQTVRQPDVRTAGLGSVEHTMILGGFGAGKVLKVEYFNNGEDWYYDHYGQNTGLPVSMVGPS